MNIKRFAISNIQEIRSFKDILLDKSTESESLDSIKSKLFNIAGPELFNTIIAEFFQSAVADFPEINYFDGVYS